MSNVDPLLGRDAELHHYATSDLSVEEQLASGASVDDLVAAGVLYDDYDPDNNPAYFFTPLEPVEQIPEGPPVPDEEFEARMNAISALSNLAKECQARCRDERRLNGDASDVSHIVKEYKGKIAKLRAAKLNRHASDTAV